MNKILEDFIKILEERKVKYSLEEDNLTVEGSLYLKGCTSLESLPERLTVEGYLGLEGCTSLESLPERLTVEGSLDLEGCTLSNVVTVSGCGRLNRDVYVIKYAKGIYVTAGCFYDTLNKFKEAVYDKYGDTKEGNEYINKILEVC